MLKWVLGGVGVAAIAAGAFFFMHGHEEHGDDAHDGDHGDMEVVEFGDLEIIDAFVVRGAGTSNTAAAFFIIENDGDEDDRLILADAAIAEAIELHTHIDDNGVMKMRPVPDGFVIPAGGEYALKRGGDHVMFMGLTVDLQEGDEFPLVLEFEKAGEITFNVTVGDAGHEGHNH